MAKQKTKRVKKRNGAWFIPVRGSYLPASPAGWMTYVPFIAYLFFAAYAGFRVSADNMTAILIIVPNWVAATAVLTWIAKRTS
jgi:hypothetical protein